MGFSRVPTPSRLGIPDMEQLLYFLALISAHELVPAEWDPAVRKMYLGIVAFDGSFEHLPRTKIRNIQTMNNLYHLPLAV